MLGIWYQDCTVEIIVGDNCGNTVTDFFLRVTISFYKKQCLPVITWNKKHSSNQVMSITYTLEKKFFSAAAFEDF